MVKSLLILRNEAGGVCICYEGKLGEEQNGFRRGCSCNDFFFLQIFNSKT